MHGIGKVIFLLNVQRGIKNTAADIVRPG